MGNIELPGQLRQRFPQGFIHRLRTGGTAHHQQNGLAAVKVEQCQSLSTVAPEKFRPQGRAGHFGFCTQGGCTLREGGGDFFSEGLAKLVGKAGSQVTFVAEDGHMMHPCAEDHRHSHEAALAEYHVRLNFPDDVGGLKGSGNDPERVGEVLPGKITAQLAALHRMIGDTGNGSHLVPLHAFFRANIVNLIPTFLQVRN